MEPLARSLYVPTCLMKKNKIENNSVQLFESTSKTDCMILGDLVNALVIPPTKGSTMGQWLVGTDTF